jgi:hypothetical protein
MLNVAYISLGAHVDIISTLYDAPPIISFLMDTLKQHNSPLKGFNWSFRIKISIADVLAISRPEFPWFAECTVCLWTTWPET